jgi:L-glyceraldehyde 3-phosphate reductase
MAKHGSLSADVLTPELLEQLRTCNAEAIEQGETMVTMALKWVLAKKGVTSVIVGARTPEQFAESLKCLY